MNPLAALVLISLFVDTIQGENKIGNGTIRINKTAENVVELRLNNEWGTICKDDLFGQPEADLICYQMGYTGASNYSSFTSLYPAKPVIQRLQCINDEFQVILQCSYSKVQDNNCPNGAGVVTVICDTNRIWDNPYPGMVRLSKGDYISEGLVEVYCNGEWGTICDDGIDDDEADTICVQLGYTKASNWDNLKLYGNSTQPVWFDNLFCGHTDKTCIGYCQACPTTKGKYCQHSEDMTVQCTYNTSVPNYDSGGSLRSTCKDITMDIGLTLKMIIIIAVSSFVGLVFCCFVIICVPTCIYFGYRLNKKPPTYAQFD